MAGLVGRSTFAVNATRGLPIGWATTLDRQGRTVTAIIIPFPLTTASATASVTAQWSERARWGHNGVTTSEAVSLERCVDWLLDRHQSTTDPVLRGLVGDVLTEVRELGDVSECEELTALVLDALASVETAFDIAS